MSLECKGIQFWDPCLVAEMHSSCGFRGLPRPSKRVLEVWPGMSKRGLHSKTRTHLQNLLSYCWYCWDGLKTPDDQVSTQIRSEDSLEGTHQCADGEMRSMKKERAQDNFYQFLPFMAVWRAGCHARCRSQGLLPNFPSSSRAAAYHQQLPRSTRRTCQGCAEVDGRTILSKRLNWFRLSRFRLGNA